MPIVLKVVLLVFCCGLLLFLVGAIALLISQLLAMSKEDGVWPFGRKERKMKKKEDCSGPAHEIRNEDIYKLRRRVTAIEDQRSYDKAVAQCDAFVHTAVLASRPFRWGIGNPDRYEPIPRTTERMRDLQEMVDMNLIGPPKSKKKKRA